MSCPYCMREEGHYLGCKALEKPGMYQNWKDAAWALGGILLVGLLLWGLVAVVGRG